MKRAGRAALWSAQVWLACAPARALPLPDAQCGEARASWLLRLAPSHEARLRARTRDLEQRLARSLRELPEVRDAQVQITVPDAAELPLDEPLPAPSASLVLVVQGRAPTGDELWQLARAVVPELTPEHLALVVRQSAPARPASRPLVSVGPFRVAAESAAALRLALALSFGANALLAGLWLTRSSRAVVARTLARWAAKRAP